MLPTITLRIERWKFNKDYGIYVSNFGNFKDRYKRRLPIKINEKGYCVVKTEAVKSQWKLAHRIVMLTWRPIPDAENLTVDHLNHNKRDNSVINLEWVTEEENLRRATEDCLYKNKNKKKNKKLSLKEYQDSIKGIKINEKLVAFNVDEVYKEVIQIYKCGYPKQTIKNKLNDFYTRKNTCGHCKLGNSITLQLVMEGNDNHVTN